MTAKERAGNYMRLKKDYKDPEDIKFQKWLDENFPIRRKNFKHKTLYAGNKYDDVYTIMELIEIYKNKNKPIKINKSLELLAWLSAIGIIALILFLIFN